MRRYAMAIVYLFLELSGTSEKTHSLCLLNKGFDEYVRKSI